MTGENEIVTFTLLGQTFRIRVGQEQAARARRVADMMVRRLENLKLEGGGDLRSALALLYEIAYEQDETAESLNKSSTYHLRAFDSARASIDHLLSLVDTVLDGAVDSSASPPEYISAPAEIAEHALIAAAMPEEKPPAAADKELPGPDTAQPEIPAVQEVPEENNLPEAVTPEEAPDEDIVEAPGEAQAFTPEGTLVETQDEAPDEAQDETREAEAEEAEEDAGAENAPRKPRKPRAPKKTRPPEPDLFTMGFADLQPDFFSDPGENRP